MRLLTIFDFFKPVVLSCTGLEIALIAGTAASTVGTLQAGKATEAAYENEAKQAELVAKADSVNATRELNETMAMQNAMFGLSGRSASEGSAQLIQNVDLERGQENIELIKAGGATKASGLRSAGKSAKKSSLFSAAGTAAQGAFQYSQVK